MQKQKLEAKYITDSKELCMQLGMDPNEIRTPKNIMSPYQLAQKKEAYEEILEVARFFSERFIKSLEDVPVLIAISDENGYLLDTIGDKTIRSTMEQLGIMSGIQFSEVDMGTNVVSLALKQNHPVQLVGKDHFHTYLHNCACYGVPFHYRDVNSLLGSICIMTGKIVHNPFFLTTLTTVVDAIERELLLRKQNYNLNLMNGIMLSKTRDAVVVHYNGKFVFANEMAAKIFGISKSEDLIGIEALLVISEDQRLLSAERINRIYSTGMSEPFVKSRIIRFDGKELDVELSSSFLSYEGKPSIMTIFTDITSKKQLDMLEVEMKKNQKSLYEAKEFNRRIAEFFANISHELKTPLNVIFSAVQTLSLTDDIELPNSFELRLNKYLKSMKQNCYRLLRLVNNLIDLSKFDSGYLKPNMRNHNIVSIVEEITLSVVGYIELKGIELIFDTDIEEKIIAVDDDKIERIILNLLSNAIKFTPRGGKITVNINDYGENILISVSDTGIGIPEDKIELIFERFGQVDATLSRNHEGSGIGLSLVKSLVNMHGGTINVKSKYGECSEFLISLPAKLVEDNNVSKPIFFDDKVERISIEFSDIYDI